MIEPTREQLREIVPSPAWADAVAEAGPFATPDQLHAAAAAALDGLTEADRLAALDAMPRFGDAVSLRQTFAGAGEHEQLTRATRRTLLRLTRANALYEARFGHVFLTDAADRSAKDVLRELKKRLKHSRDAERDVAADQLRTVIHRELTARFGDG